MQVMMKISEVMMKMADGDGDHQEDVESQKIKKARRSTSYNSKPEQEKSIESDDLSTQSSTVLGCLIN